MNIRLVITSLVCLALAQSGLQAQGNLLLDEPEAVSLLIETHKHHNQHQPTAYGYRVQVLQNSNQELVDREKSKLANMHPELRVYELYEAPFFKIRAGDFTNRFEAYRVFQQLKRTFRLSFIVPDEVNIGRL